MLAAFGYFYTVIPLYQKAMLDEEIAKKELELKATRKALVESYSKLRRYVIKSFVFSAGAQCTGLLIPPLGPEASREERNAERRAVLTHEVPPCLLTQLDKTPEVDSLKKSDRAFLVKQLNLIGQESEKLRKSALEEYDTLRSRVNADLNLLQPPSAESFTSRLLKELDPYLSSQVSAELSRMSQINSALLAITLHYEHQLQQQILTINKLQWPQDSSRE